LKKILLVSNHIFHYRVKVYNYFYDEFRRRGYDFSVIAPSWQEEAGVKAAFPMQVQEFSSRGYVDYIAKEKPDVVITFLHLKDVVIFPVTVYCRMKGIPVIYWNHGVNLETPDAKLKNAVFRKVHDISDAIILYSPNEKKYVSEKNMHKVFIGYNTLNFEDIDRSNVMPPDAIRSKYGIREKDYVLFVGRMNENKRVDVLLSNLANEEYAVVIIGKGMSEEQRAIADSAPNIYYLGAIWDTLDFNSLFSACKVFSIPGHLGLGLNEAFFWGKPVVTMDVKHPPEVFYLRNGFNGFITNDEKELKERIEYIIRDPQFQEELSKNAMETACGIAHISNMFRGFVDAVEYVQEVKKRAQEHK